MGQKDESLYITVMTKKKAALARKKGGFVMKT
jgi:hypothetical protein